MEGTFDKYRAMEAQKKLCEENGWPHFAPTNGRCWRCGKNIYEKSVNTLTGQESGISVEYAATRLVTGCPHCNRSYCD